jgi:hypothetical protein
MYHFKQLKTPSKDHILPSHAETLHPLSPLGGAFVFRSYPPSFNHYHFFLCSRPFSIGRLVKALRGDFICGCARSRPKEAPPLLSHARGRKRSG